jgi:hypothetical protein
MQGVSFNRPFATHTIIRPGFYYQNFRKFFLSKSENNRLTFTLPMLNHPIDAFNAHDIGHIALKVFEEPYLYDRQRIDIAAEQLKPQQFIEAIKRVSDKEVALIEVPRDEYDSDFPFKLHWN